MAFGAGRHCIVSRHCIDEDEGCVEGRQEACQHQRQNVSRALLHSHGDGISDRGSGLGIIQRSGLGIAQGSSLGIIQGSGLGIIQGSGLGITQGSGLGITQGLGLGA